MGRKKEQGKHSTCSLQSKVHWVQLKFCAAANTQPGEL